MSTNDEEQATVTPHEELCDEALKHYLEISNQASDFTSLIPKAIEYYKRWRPQGKRKIVRTPGAMEKALSEGWMFDPWLNPMGRPFIIGDQPYKGDHPALSAVDPREPSIYWILVQGSPEQIVALDPFVDLPEDEEEEPPKPVTEADRLALAKDFVEIKPPDEPGVIPEKYAGWTIFKATKGNLQLILPREEKE